MKRAIGLFTCASLLTVCRRKFQGRDWDPSRWNVHAQRASGTKEDAKALNVFLDTLQSKVYDARQQLLENNKAITAELLKNILKGKTERPKAMEIWCLRHGDQKSGL